MDETSHIFTMADQKSFAELSGDNNPIHIDPVAARRTIYGQTVVHGMHGVLWALNEWLRSQNTSITLVTIKGSFLKPLKVGQEADLSIQQKKENQIEIILSTHQKVSVLLFEFQERSDQDEFNPQMELPESLTCKELAADSIQKAGGSLDLCVSRELLEKQFPFLLAKLLLKQTAILLAATRLVGMECPGLHSIFSQFEFRFEEKLDHSEKLSYQVTDFDSRFNLADIRVSTSDMKGAIKAFLRPKPQGQASYQDMAQHVIQDKFSDQKALVIGGSRGLGEVLVKLLVAGGADVTFTYYQGEREACRLIEELRAHGRSAAGFAYNVLSSESENLKDLNSETEFTHLYYFASPHISSGPKNQFSEELYKKYKDYYVDGLVNIISQMGDDDLKYVFYPSTGFIDEKAANFAEYVAAKKDGEAACREIEKEYQGLQIYMPRLGRLATDQTANLQGINYQEPHPVLLSHLDIFQEMETRS